MVSRENEDCLNYIRKCLREGKHIYPLFNLETDSKNWYLLRDFNLQVDSIQEDLQLGEANWVFLKDKEGNSFRTKFFLNEYDYPNPGDIIKTFGGIVNGKLRTPIGFYKYNDSFVELSSINPAKGAIQLEEKYEKIANNNKTKNGRLSFIEVEGLKG